jgi:hypothetical protein
MVYPVGTLFFNNWSPQVRRNWLTLRNLFALFPTASLPIRNYLVTSEIYLVRDNVKPTFRDS